MYSQSSGAQCMNQLHRLSQLSQYNTRTTCYLNKYIKRFVVPSHLLSKHPCALHFHPGWSDLSSLGSRERKQGKNTFKVTSPRTCFNIPCTLKDLRVNDWVMFSCMNQKILTEQVFLWQCQKTSFQPSAPLQNFDFPFAGTCLRALELPWSARHPDLKYLCLCTTGY